MAKIKVGQEDVVVPLSKTEAREAFAQLIENYKKQNPAKYELKKEALEAKLASL